MKKVLKTKKTNPKENELKIKIPPLNLKMVKITIEGLTPLLVHKFSAKSAQQMADKDSKKARGAKEARNPLEEFEGSLYRIPGKNNKFGIPTSGIKNCAVTACRFIEGLPMTVATGSFHVLDDGTGLTEIIGSKPVMDTRIVRIGGFKKIATNRYRGRFDKWKLTFPVQYNPSMLSAAQLVHLYENAGFSVGLCEHRPEKRGSLGMFKVKRG